MSVGEKEEHNLKAAEVDVEKTGSKVMENEKRSECKERRIYKYSGAACVLLTTVMLKYLEGVEGAAEDEQAIVAQRRHHPQSGQIADQMYLTDTGVVIDHLRGEKGRGCSSCINKCKLTL